MKHLKSTPLFALVLIASIGSLQAAPTKITAPQAITVPGNYVLANDITGGIGIQASDVILNLNGHTITAQGGISIAQFDTGGLPLVNVRVSNGQIIATSGGTAVAIFGSSCLITGLNITVGLAPIPGFGFGGTAIEIEHGNFNRVNSCIITGQGGQFAFELTWASHNTIQNNTLVGTFLNTLEEQDQVVTPASTFTVAGDNTISGNQFASPTP